MNTQHKRVTQECTVCGHQFDLMYHSNGTYTYMDEPCECEAEFIPLGPSLAEWLETVGTKLTKTIPERKSSTLNGTDCPYCGNVMTPVARLKTKASGVGVDWQCYFRCEKCLATSPVVIIDRKTEGEAISAAQAVAKHRHVPTKACVSREEYGTMQADRDSWKEAFGESNEKIAEEVKRRETVDRENERLRRIIVQHLPHDSVCALCEHFAQCKQDALEEDNAKTREESIFWNCDGFSRFVPKEED